MILRLQPVPSLLPVTVQLVAVSAVLSKDAPALGLLVEVNVTALTRNCFGILRHVPTTREGAGS
jgi:hypothetical protein